MTKKEIELIEKEIEDNLKAGECGLASNNEKFQWTNTANAMKKMLEENKKLKDNWNKLKEYLEICINIIKANLIDKKTPFEHSSLLSLGATLSKMEELEQGNGNDER